MARVIPAFLLALAAAACSSDEAGPPASGQATPTVAGGPAPAYASHQEARQAFTRRSEDEVLTATLEDASWLRFEGDPETVRERHRAYFAYGYTSFQVVLRSNEYTRPTEEVFLLEDDTGARVESKPITFQGSMQLVDDRWQFSFDLAFQHVLSKDTQWLRLTRVKDGASVEWRFR